MDCNAVDEAKKKKIEVVKKAMDTDIPKKMSKIISKEVTTQTGNVTALL